MSDAPIEESESDVAGGVDDQTAADLDQSAADRDEIAAEQDQLAADRDQVAADVDRAAAIDHGSKPADGNGYARTRRARARSARDRDAASRIRAQTALARDEAAARRDQTASARDAAARVRDELAAKLEADLERLDLEDSVEAEASPGADALRRLRNRHRAGLGRSRAAMQREAAAQDRELAAHDRAHAAHDRDHAAAELAAEGIDDLTGAMLRRVGLGAIQREMDRTLRSGEGLVLAYVDVDGLKAVNDSAGHMAGDVLLTSVADSITHDLRSYDVICRFGGDEFLCSLAGHDADGAGERFQQIGQRLSHATSGGTITVGLAERREGDTVETLVGRADAALIELRQAARRD